MTPASRSRGDPFDIGLMGAAIGFLYPVVLGALAFFDDGALDPRWTERIVFVALTCVPAAIALAARRRRPGLYVLSAVLTLPLSFLSLAGATLPLLIPGAMYVVAAMREQRRGRVPLLLNALVTTALCVAAVAAPFVHPDPVCWTRATFVDGSVDYREFRPRGDVGDWERGNHFVGGDMEVLERARGCSSDRVMPWETATAVGLLVAAVAASVWMSGPTSREGSGLSTLEGSGAS